MSPRLQQKLDPEGIVQSALKSFFRSPHAAMADVPLRIDAQQEISDDGTTVDEIAQQCQSGKRTVERLQAKLRDTLRQETTTLHLDARRVGRLQAK